MLFFDKLNDVHCHSTVHNSNKIYFQLREIVSENPEILKSCSFVNSETEKRLYNIVLLSKETINNKLDTGVPKFERIWYLRSRPEYVLTRA